MTPPGLLSLLAYFLCNVLPSKYLPFLENVTVDSVCVCACVSMCMSVTTVLASWYRVVLDALAAERDIVWSWEYFRPAPVWTAEQRMVILWGFVAVFPIPYWDYLHDLNMPGESRDPNLRSREDFRILIPDSTWFMYTTWMGVEFGFLHPCCLRVLVQRRRSRRGAQKAFE